MKTKVEERVFHRHKGYKGCIRWAKIKINGKHFKVEKRRPFGWESYEISESEYNWIDSPNKAEKMWGFCHYHGTATWFGGDLSHPITKAVYQNEEAGSPRPVAMIEHPTTKDNGHDNRNI